MSWLKRKAICLSFCSKVWCHKFEFLHHFNSKPLCLWCLLEHVTLLMLFFFLGILPYAFIISSHVTTFKLFFSFFASLINWDLTAVCWRQLDTPGTPPFCMEVSVYLFAKTKSSILSDLIEKYSFPSKFRSDMVLNFPQFGCTFYSTSYVSLKVFLTHMLLRHWNRSLATFGHLLYTQ